MVLAGLAAVQRLAQRQRARGANAPVAAVHGVAHAELAGRVAPAQCATHARVAKSGAVGGKHPVVFFQKALRPAQGFAQHQILRAPALAL